MYIASLEILERSTILTTQFHRFIIDGISIESSGYFFPPRCGDSGWMFYLLPELYNFGF